MVSRTPGRGTIILPHVSRHSIALQRLIGFSTLLRERYADVSVEERHWVEDQASALAAEAMAVPHDTAVVKTSKLYVADGQPAIHIGTRSRSATSVRAIRRICEPARRRRCSTRSSRCRSRGPVTRSTTPSSSSSQRSPRPTRSSLCPEPGAPFLTLQETHYTVLGEAVAYSTVLIDDRYLRLQVVRHS